jgi:hypothetical protein
LKSRINLDVKKPLFIKAYDYNPTIENVVQGKKLSGIMDKTTDFADTHPQKI